jgi:tetratricopeptide (TPR) repeat protein
MKKLMIIGILFIGWNVLFAQNTIDILHDLVAIRNYSEAVKLIPKAVHENPKNEQLMLLCGDVYTELENLDSALIMYRKADDIHGDQLKTMRKIGETLSLMGKHLDAIKELKSAIKEAPDDVYNYLELGTVYIRADSLSMAEFNITKAREMDKKIPDAYVALGDLYFAQKVYELAKNNYEEALSIDPELTDARIKLATAYYWLGMREFDKDLANGYFEKSLVEWNTITKKDSTNAKAYFEQGKILFFSRQYDNAAKSLYRYVELRPSGSLGRWYLAQSLYELRYSDSAAPQLKICSEQIDSVKKKALLLLARCYYDAGKYIECVNTYKELKSIDEIELDDYKRIASAALSYGKDTIYTVTINNGIKNITKEVKGGDTAYAVQVYKEAIDKFPIDCKFVYDVGRFLMFVIKDYNGAIDLFKKRLENCKDTLDQEIDYFIGYGFVLQKMPDSAYVYLQSSLALNPADLNAHLYLGDVYATLKKTDSAKIEFEYIINSAKPNDEANKWVLTQAFFKICGLYLEQKKANDLMKMSQKWIDVMPDSPYGYLYKAVAYQLQDDTENACKFYKKALFVDPKLQQAKEMLKKLKCQ